MVIATSGFGSINYNRIVSSSISPYSISITDTKQFRDETLRDRKIRGLYIIDKNNVVALIYENNQKTYIANLNFIGLTAIWKPSFPNI